MLEAATVGVWTRIANAHYPNPDGARLLALRMQTGGPGVGISAVELRIRTITVTFAGATVVDSHWSLEVYTLNAFGLLTLRATITDPWPDPAVGFTNANFRYTDAPGHRVALAVRPSTLIPPSSWASDGAWTLYIDDVAVASETGIAFRAYPFGALDDDPVLVGLGATHTTDRVWVRAGMVVPATTADGALIGSPTDLAFYDDFSSGIGAGWLPWNAHIALGAEFPAVRPDLGGGGGQGLAWKPTATLAGLWVNGDTPILHPGVQQVLVLPEPPVTPPGLPAACPVDFTPTPAPGGAACASPVLP